MNPSIRGQFELLVEKMQQDSKEMQQIWREGMVFTWQWWLLVALTVVPWVLWVFYRRKESTSRLMLAGLFIICISKLLDTMGSAFGLWTYTFRILPIMPPLLPWDTTLLPVAVMSIIQFKPAIKPIFKAVIFAAVSSFIVEPVAVWIGLYKPEAWKHVYSFFVFGVLYLAADWVSKRRNFERL